MLEFAIASNVDVLFYAVISVRAIMCAAHYLQNRFGRARAREEKARKSFFFLLKKAVTLHTFIKIQTVEPRTRTQMRHSVSCVLET